MELPSNKSQRFIVLILSVLVLSILLAVFRICYDEVEGTVRFWSVVGIVYLGNKMADFYEKD